MFVTLARNFFKKNQLRDTYGQTLIIPSRPRRIVSQTLATDEILLALCAPSRIVALSALAGDVKYSNVVEKAQQVAGQAGDNVEQILSFQADLIYYCKLYSAGNG